MTDEECGSLNVYMDEQGFISCWRPTLIERIKLVVTRDIWLRIVGRSHPPVWVSTESPFEKPRKKLFGIGLFRKRSKK
jgi:hypothetical protein